MAKLNLHMFGIGLFTKRAGKPMFVLLPDTDSHTGHGMEAHQLWIAYRQDQAGGGCGAGDVPWKGNGRLGHALCSRQLQKNVSVDFSPWVSMDTNTTLPKRLANVTKLSGKKVADSLLEPTVKSTKIRGRVTLPAGRGTVLQKGKRWWVQGVGGREEVWLDPGSTWSMDLKGSATTLTLELKRLDTAGAMASLPQLTGGTGGIDLWLFHVPKSEVQGPVRPREPDMDAPAGHFPAYYEIDGLDAPGARPIPKYIKPQPVALADDESDKDIDGIEEIAGINPFTCMMGGAEP